MRVANLVTKEWKTVLLKKLDIEPFRITIPFMPLSPLGSHKGKDERHGNTKTGQTSSGFRVNFLRSDT